MSVKSQKKKLRLDQLVFDRGLADSRQKAKAMILAGSVIVGEHAVTKAGHQVLPDVAIRLKGDQCPYVSRGGLKLAGAMEHFGIDPTGFVCLDVGASTGGFTDYLLQHGAEKSYTIDVGKNQLAWKLRSDPRVICREGFHAKNLKREDVPDKVDLIVIDVSFISLRHIFVPLVPFLSEQSRMLAMVKPQFEVGKNLVGKGGVVRDEALQKKAVADIREFLQELGFKSQDPCPAPIKGPKGNQEYFLYVDHE